MKISIPVLFVTRASGIGDLLDALQVAGLPVTNHYPFQDITNLLFADTDPYHLWEAREAYDRLADTVPDPINYVIHIDWEDGDWHDIDLVVATDRRAHVEYVVPADIANPTS